MIKIIEKVLNIFTVVDKFLLYSRIWLLYFTLTRRIDWQKLTKDRVDLAQF